MITQIVQMETEIQTLGSRAHALSHLTKPTLSNIVIVELNLQNAHALKVHCLKTCAFK